MTKQIVIIGAGIVGISAAAFLQRAGENVTVIDRLPPGEGCSFGNAGGIAFAEIMPGLHPKMFRKIPGWLLDPLGPLTIRWRYLLKAMPWLLQAAQQTTSKRMDEITTARAALGLRAVADFETLLGEAGALDLMVKRETLRIFDDVKQFEAEQFERDVKARHGFPVQIYSGDEAREMEPDLGFNVHSATTHGGWYFVKNPLSVVQSIAKKFVASGGMIITNNVAKISVEGNRAQAIALTNGKIVKADHVVICAGAYSHLLSKQWGENFRLEAERGYHMVLPNSGVTLSRSITYARTPGAATPMDVGLRLAGTDEFAGLDAEPNYARSDALFHVFKKILPGLKAPDAATTRWMGRRPGLPDSLPVISNSYKLENVTYGFGHGHMGLTWGPTTGRLIAELVTRRPSNLDLTPFRASRPAVRA